MKKHLYLLSALLFIATYAKAQIVYDYPDSQKPIREFTINYRQNITNDPVFKSVNYPGYVKSASKTKLTGKEKIENKPWFVGKYSISGGAFFPINNTQIQVGNSAGTIGTVIDFEDDLNLSKNTQTFLIGGDIHLGRRSKMELVYYRFHRNSSATLDKEIHFGDSIYPVNASVKGFFNSDIYRFAYGYAFISNPKVEAGLSFGLHIIDTEVGLQGIGVNRGFDASKDFGLTAPLPDFGIWGGYAISKRWAISGEFDYFSLKIGNVKGRILGGNFFVKYKAIDRLIINAGYTGFNFKVDAEKNNKVGFLKWGYNGPSISVNYLLGTLGKGPM
ncbi:hypothetical protein [Solitalea canadensis]|uniref:Bacteroidetes-specific membrane protein n=1 Tax=Solitalea canadensis (strain ATCC 29591 / DSM 3403 / JCM 21819 / LMG 8368 / NBRC 15130 / NCIMB 12057 / USAM 9D) TaxID=929556 RepID=H8KVP6_SOLCM|nr:hypothetical protein [Solitalea canadensis]AFD06669.1 hypothetical protein Solca_1602 [Solitalea canadensis DSM 3403]